MRLMIVSGLCFVKKHGSTEFLGYNTVNSEGVVQAIVVNGEEVQSASEGETAAFVTNQTPFYGESGGQLGDRGEIRFDGGVIAITDTKKRGEGLFVHYGSVSAGEIQIGMAVELQVDPASRAGSQAHHSATHLIHEALREVLGDHVAQKGSLVAPDRLRFDFSHQKAISQEDLNIVEDMANEIVRQSSPVETRLMAVDDAIELGAMALFGEKYGDEVRVVSMGTAVRGESAGSTYSLELCGGTHVSNTGEIGLVHLLGESAVASGVRRIEALTGNAALEYLGEQETRVKEIAGVLKVPPHDAVNRVATLVEERKKLERELADARKQLAMGGSSSMGGGASAKDIGGISFIGQVVENIAAKELKGLVDEAKQSLGSGVVAIAGISEDGKAGVVVGVTEDLTTRFNAVDLVRIASEAVGGKGGGGRPDMAQAGGPDGAKAQAAIDAIEAAIS